MIDFATIVAPLGFALIALLAGVLYLAEWLFTGIQELIEQTDGDNTR